MIKIILNEYDKKELSKQSTLIHGKLKEKLLKEFSKEDFRITPPLPGFIPRIKRKYIAEIFIRIKKNSNNLLPSEEYIEKRNKILKILPDTAMIKIDPMNLFMNK